MSSVISYISFLDQIYTILDFPGRSIREMKRQLLSLAGQPNFRPANFKFKVKMIGGMNDRRVRFIFSVPNTWVYPENMGYAINSWYDSSFHPEMTTEIAHFMGLPDLSWRIREYMSVPPMSTDEYHRVPVSMVVAVESYVGFTRATSTTPVGGFYPVGEVFYRNPIDFIGLPDSITDRIHEYIGLGNLAGINSIYHDR